MSYFDEALEQINDGLSGNNEGIPIPFERLRQYLPNIQKKTQYLIFAGTKVGKTAFTDSVFFYGAYDHYKTLKDKDELNGFDLDIDYFSYEIDIQTKIIKGVSRKLWLDYGIVVDSNVILSKGKNRISTEIYDLVLKFRNYFEDLESICTIHSSVDNPTGILKYLEDKAKTKGEIIQKNIQKDPAKPPIMRFHRFIPHNKKAYWLGFMDHIALMQTENSNSTKENIDAMSTYFVRLRNNYSMTPIIIQQSAFDSENDERHKSGRLTPTLKDLGDSRYSSRDANVIIALFNPSYYRMDKFQGYDINRLGNAYRNLEIIVNRDGEPNINIGLNFAGAAGTFRELPKAAEMTPELYQYMASLKNDDSTYIQKDGLWIKRA